MNEKPFESMNVIPFVDIMLVLLTIVLTTSTFIATGRIPVNLPQASTSEKNADRPQVIEMTTTGGLYLNGAQTTMEALRGGIAALDRQTPFIIRADRDIPLQRFVDVADLLKQLNFAKVAIQTKSGG
ncbi:MAG: ExbD/TolR family protein [Bacteroidota bacterium]